MWQVFQKFREFRMALDAGDWGRASRLAVEVLNLLIPEDGTDGAIREPVGDAAAFTVEGFEADAKAVKSAVAKKPRGAKAQEAGGPLIVTIVATFGPLLVEWIRKRIKERQG